MWQEEINFKYDKSVPCDNGLSITLQGCDHYDTNACIFSFHLWNAAQSVFIIVHEMYLNLFHTKHSYLKQFESIYTKLSYLKIQVGQIHNKLSY